MEPLHRSSARSTPPPRNRGARRSHFVLHPHMRSREAINCHRATGGTGFSFDEGGTRMTAARTFPIQIDRGGTPARRRGRIFARAPGRGLDVMSSGARAIIHLYDEIGPDGISAAA